MILRRLAEALKQQNWAAIAIEFVLLVAGVFLGIQVANWNQSLADERLGRVYAQRLTADIEQDLATRRALVAYYRAVLDNVERTDALLVDPQADPKELVVAAYRSSEIAYKASARATWDEIVSSGDTGLLRSEVASRVAEYYAFDNARVALDFLSASAYRHRVRTIIPLPMQKALRAACSDAYDAANLAVGFVAVCKLDIAPATVAATAAALRDDPAVRAELRYQYSDVFSAHRNIGGDVVDIEHALAALKGGRAPSEITP